jgi:creatinine amidohydrolase
LRRRAAFATDDVPFRRRLRHIPTTSQALRLPSRERSRMGLGTRSWQDLPWTDFAHLPHDTVAVLPVAAIEQHGPHLPVSVDAVIGDGVIAAALRHLPEAAPVLVLPMQAVANSVEHLRFPGTLTTSPETLLALVVDIGASVARAGVRRLVLCNSHGGNAPVLEIAARRIRIQSGILAVTTAWARLGRPEALRDPAEASWGLHAGRDETSLMLALAPDRVRMQHAAAFASDWQRVAAAQPALHPQAGASLSWQAQDLNPAGAVGDAATATAELGQALLDHAARRLAALLLDVAAFDVDAWLAKEPKPHG